MSTAQSEGWVVGTDEVGCGALAGETLVCAVAVPRFWTPPVGLRDSKACSERDLQRLYEELQKSDVPRFLVGKTSQDIDRDGIRNILIELHQCVVDLMRQELGDILEIVVDGNLPIRGATSVAKADALYPAVSAASVIAKVNRDFRMREAHKRWPIYDFQNNVGYDTVKHRRALDEHGPCPIHRFSFAPVQSAADRHKVRWETHV